MVKTYNSIVYEYGDFSLYSTTSSKLLVKNMLKNEFEAIAKVFKPSNKITKINLKNNKKTIYLVPVNERGNVGKMFKNRENVLWIFDMPYKHDEAGEVYEYGTLT